MESWNTAAWEILERVSALIEPVALPLAVAGWFAGVAACIGMALPLRGRLTREVWVPSLAVAVLSLAAHMADYLVTLRVSPTLAMEGNPLWRAVIDRFGLDLARVYGLSGKVMLSALAFECFAFYLVQRRRLFPETGLGFLAFWRRFGGTGRPVRFANLVSFLTFSFALLGPVCFYVAVLNLLVDHPVYFRLPSLPVALCLYILGLTALYLWQTWRAYRRSRP